MRKFSILHLSDLHIKKGRNNKYSPVFRKLINDIVSETKNIDALILIVTGDIIDKADFSETSDVAVLFFSDLITGLNKKIKKIYFTPGNHDKKRVGCNDLLQTYFNEKKYDELYDEFESGDWKHLFKYTFSDYINLVNKISEATKINIQSDLFYADLIELNDCYIRINAINSSLTSFNDKDYGSLHIGKFQIDKIEQDFEKIKETVSDKKIDVSITIMHHPTFWLCKEEYDDIQHSISSPDSLATDVILRGHTHDRSLENYYSLYTSFSTLVTGIGESENGQEHPQRYSIYTFMCDLNLIEIVMRASSEKGFIPDYSAYVSETDESRKKIHFPMHVHDFISDTYLRLPLTQNDFQPIFPTKEVFGRITAYSKKLLDFKEHLANVIFTYKQEFITNLHENEEICSEDISNYLFKQGFNESGSSIEIEKAEAIFDKYKNTILEIVKGLLYEFCFEFTNVFFDGTLNEDEQVRVQFRVFNKTTCSHEGLTNYSLKGNEPSALIDITPVLWGKGLIKHSFVTKSPFIYSLNSEFIDDRIEDTDWNDYITYSPNVPTNSYYDARKKDNYPAVTFGINCKCLGCYRFFETMSLLPLKSVIDDFLLNIHNSFNFSFETLIKKNK